MKADNHQPQPPDARILVVEDEAAMRLALEDCLKAQGYRVLSAADGETGLQKAVEQQPDVILLDVMMPKLDGFGFCRALRRTSSRSMILMLTAKGLAEDRVRGLDLGADDYLVKPFRSEELLARVRALVRRLRRTEPGPEELRLGDVRVDLVRHTASHKGKSLHLTAKEYAMLRLLADHRGTPVSREQFLDAVWGYAAFPTTRTVDNHVANLRLKLEADPDHPRWIQTVHGVGYRLELDPGEAST